ncbi:MAG: 2-amino-4-hydroxy-6-hydroxymethyldihydropteridine pyrophosphokinase [Leptospiraceae bacterium]|nr:MAG: 2-amino-4-hydroxy-6-hydroxymethyldihydropteridine pyrophosphokinase [Leptospiraceae bacterium]
MQKIIDLKKQNLSTNNSSFVLLSLGSNIEPKLDYLNKAIFYLNNDGYCKIIKLSKILKNPAILYTKQDDFLNQIIEIKTFLNPFELLDYVKELEKRIGRQPRFRYGPREIDIDILFYEHFTVNTDKLIIPHPGVYEREYLKILLQEFELSKYHFNI